MWKTASGLSNVVVASLTRRRHRPVERRVDLGQRVDVVEDAVGVEDPVGLTDHDPHHVRHVHAALLIEHHRRLGSGPGLPGREPLRDPDHDVPHGVAAAEGQHLVRHGRRVLLGARGVGVHGERPESGGFPVESDGSGDRRGREGHARPQTAPRPARPPATTCSSSRACSAPWSSSTRLRRRRDAASRPRSNPAVGAGIRFRANCTPDPPRGQPPAAVAA